MEVYCKHRRTNFLLDDENVSGECEKCKATTEMELLINGEEDSFVNSNGMAVNSSDSIDAPLLINDRYEYDTVQMPLETFHCHPLGQLSQDDRARKKLFAASCMCLLFMIAEIIGGNLAGSISVMTDAAHLMSDFIGFLVSLFSLWVGQKASTSKMSFGFYRAEVLGALFSVILVWLLTGIFVYLAVMRLIEGDYDIHANTMMVVALLGVLINIVMGLTLHGICFNHKHSHGSFKHTEKNINVRAAAIHVLGDLIQSTGVFVAAVIIKFYPDAKIADPICTFFFSAIVLVTTRNVFKDTVDVLMEGVPKNLSFQVVKNALKSIDGVRHVHSLNIWSLTLDKNAVTAHLAVDQFCDKETVLSQATRLVRCKFNAVFASVQVENYKEDVIAGCLQCQLPDDV